MNRAFVITAAFLLAAGFFTLPCTAEPPALSPEAEDEAALLKAAKTAELHGIAVYGPVEYDLHGQGVKEWSKLIKTLRDAKGKDVARIREYMPKRVLELAAKDGTIEQLAQPPRPGQSEPLELVGLKSDFLYGFREILNDHDFYDEEAFKALTLDDELKRLIKLGKKRTMHQAALLHWGVMKAILPDSIPDVPPGFRTIRVQVRDEKEVILVLSCSGACHWDVDVKPGAKVTGVILCGCHAQEVELYENPVKDAPIVYRAAHTQDGTPRYLTTDKHYDGYEVDEKGKIRKQFEAGIKELTGKGEFVSMQRESRPKSEPYIIPPKKK
jgi:hypothetical protein